MLGVKNKLRNAWAYFRWGLYTGGLFSGFYGMNQWTSILPGPLQS